MTTFGLGHNIEYWTGYLQHYLTNNQILDDLDQLEESIRSSYSEQPNTTASRIITNITVNWKVWLMHFKILYPAFYKYLDLGNIFRTGSLFLKATSNCKGLTKFKICQFHIIYPITNTIHTLQLTVKATIHFLQEDRENFPWVLSVFENNIAIKNATLNLLNRINPLSKVFRRNNIPTE